MISSTASDTVPTTVTPTNHTTIATNNSKKQSLVWKFFEQDPTDKDKVFCKLCKKSISRNGNTTNMNSHLKAMHQEKLPNQPSQPKISQFALPKIQQDTIDHEVAIFVASKCLPLSLVESPAFRRFMSKICPSYKVTCVKTMKKKHIKPMTRQIRQKIIDEMKGTKFALTCDLWTNVNQESFLGLTCHYIYNDAKSNVTLECAPFNEKHNNVNIREMVTIFFSISVTY